VTADLVAAGDASRASALAQAAQTVERAATALVAELARRAANGIKPLLVKAAETFLVGHDLTQRAARALLKSGGDGGWRLEALDGKSVGVVLVDSGVIQAPLTESSLAATPLNTRVSVTPNAVARMKTEQPHSLRGNSAQYAGVRDTGIGSDGPEIMPPGEEEGIL
jgi:hypothetical protein